MTRPAATWRILLLAMLAWLIVPLAASAQDLMGRRLALVIGNSNYESVYALKNAVNDANAVAAALEMLGFDVTLLTDATHAEIDAAIDAMGKRAAAEHVQATLTYYSGHGFQLGGANYIVPVDAVLDNRDRIEAQTIRLDSIIARLESDDRQTIILLDACRDNPLPASVRGTDSAKGLAEVRTGINTYIAFATSPGAVSMDGKGANGPFAEAFVRNVSLPDMSVSDMMSIVRTSVRAQTKGMQTPWDNNTLLSPFYFNPGTFVANADDGGFSMGGPVTQPGPGPSAGQPQGNTQVAVNDPVPVTPTTPGQTTPTVLSPGGFGEGGTVVPATGTTVRPVTSTTTTQVADIPEETRTVSQPQTTPVSGTTPAGNVAQPGRTEVVPTGPVQPAEEQETKVADIPSTVPHLAPLDEQPDVIEGVEVGPDGSTPIGTTQPETPVTPVPEEEPIDVALAVQTELKRVGCYTGALDGDWGPGSRGALKRFFVGIREASLDVTEPTTEVLAVIKTRDDTVCEREVVATPQPPKKQPTQPSTPKKQQTQTTPKPPPTQTAVEQPKIKIGVGTGTFR